MLYLPGLFAPGPAPCRRVGAAPCHPAPCRLPSATRKSSLSSRNCATQRAALPHAPCMPRCAQAAPSCDGTHGTLIGKEKWVPAACSALGGGREKTRTCGGREAPLPPTLEPKGLRIEHAYRTTPTTEEHNKPIRHPYCAESFVDQTHSLRATGSTQHQHLCPCVRSRRRNASRAASGCTAAGRRASPHRRGHKHQ